MAKAKKRNPVPSLCDVIYSISESLPSRYDTACYGRLRKWQTLGAITEMMVEQNLRLIDHARDKSARSSSSRRRKHIAGALSHGDFNITLDSRLGKTAFVKSMAVLRRAERSIHHRSIRIRYPDGERHFIDVLVIGQQIRPYIDHIEFDAKVMLCEAPVIVPPA